MLPSTLKAPDQQAAEGTLLSRLVALTPEDVGRAFRGRLTSTRRRRTAEVLAILADMGHARALEGEARYAPRR